MKKIAFLPLAILLASAVFLACGGDDDGGGGQTILPPVSLPVDTEINGLVSITTKNVRSGSTEVTTYPTSATLGAYAVDDPVNFDPVAEATIRQDSTYSLTVNTVPGTVLYLYLQNQGVTTRLEPVFVAGGNLRNDISLNQKVVTIKGSTTGYKENGSAASVYAVRIKDSAGRTLGNVVVPFLGTPVTAYEVDVEVPSETATYDIFVASGMTEAMLGLVIKAGDVSVSKDAGGDITKNIDFNRETTVIKGDITYKRDNSNVSVSTVYVSTSDDPDIDDFTATLIGFGQATSQAAPTPYEVKITRPKAATTVYVYAPGLDGGSGLTYLDKVEVGANAATVTKNLAYSVETTSITGNLTYKENGTAVALSVSVGLSVLDGDGNNLGSVLVTPTGTVGTYQYTAFITRPKTATTVYIDYNEAKSGGISIAANAASKTADVEISRSVSVIKGSIGGTGKSALSNGGSIYVYTSPYPVSTPDNNLISDWQETRIGNAGITVPSGMMGSGPYTYEGKIAKLEINTHVYYYVYDSLGNYYKIGEADLEADKATYTKDFIIGLVNKKIVPSF
jgi:hypothetical protein